MSNDALSLIILAVILAVVIFFFLRISIRIRKRGGSLTSIMYGATYEFYGQDKRQAIKEVVEQKAEKKRKDQDSGDSMDEQNDAPANEEVIRELYPK